MNRSFVTSSSESAELVHFSMTSSCLVIARVVHSSVSVSIHARVMENEWGSTGSVTDITAKSCVWVRVQTHMTCVFTGLCRQPLPPHVNTTGCSGFSQKNKQHSRGASHWHFPPHSFFWVAPHPSVSGELSCYTTCDTPVLGSSHS